MTILKTLLTKLRRNTPVRSPKLPKALPNTALGTATGGALNAYLW